ncbi:FkbM family methyltransferase [Alkalilimnicola ehrlichii MLHE-1]|nr:FkbM family methyltransferase [Alkalilimnicola ehrlichii]
MPKHSAPIQTYRAIAQALNAGDIHGARILCDKALERNSSDGCVLTLHARLLWQEGRPEEALSASREALDQGGEGAADAAAIHAQFLLELNHTDDALGFLRRAAEKAPEHRRLQALLAQALVKANRREQARDILVELIKTQPDADTLNSLGHVLFDLGDGEAGFQQLQLAGVLEPGNHVLWSNILMMAHYLPSQSARDLRKLHARWYANCAAHLETERHFERDRDPERPLRIGFISNGFHSHPAGWLSFGAINTLARYFDHTLHLYSTAPPRPKDFLSHRFQNMTGHWCQMVHWSQEAIHAQLLKDRLDILVDMTGHSGYSALSAIARRAAPVQVKWVGGLFNTSAVPTIDYLLTDWMETPEGVEEFYTEKLIRLPTGYVTYAPPPYLPDIAPLPAKENGYITFACMNNLHKVNREIAGVWAGILKAVPDSRLLIKDKKLSDPGARKQLWHMLVEAGVPDTRLILEEGAPHRYLLETYHRVDIALDPWPYSGGLTTIEGLYMGVPVITCPGPTFAGRHAASHLHNSGLDQFIAADFHDYKQIAVETAGDIEKLEALRAGLRKQCQNSPLGNHAQFATNLDRAFRTIWRRWCADAQPAHLHFSKPARIPSHITARMKAELQDRDSQRAGNSRTAPRFRLAGLEAAAIQQPNDRDETNGDVAPTLPSEAVKATVTGPDNQSRSLLIPKGETFRLKNIFEEEEYALPAGFHISPEMVVVDVGANIGAFALYADLWSPHCIVHCFEPNPQVLPLLERNKQEARGTIQIHPFALSDEDGELTLWQHPRNTGETSLARRSDGATQVQVPVRNALDALTAAGVDHIDVLKIDTEGSEVPVVQTLVPFLPKVSIVMLEYHSEADRRALDRLLSDFQLYDCTVMGASGVGTVKYFNNALKQSKV